MLGFADNFVSGPWLFKAESALNTGINYRSTAKKNRLDLLFGFDYMGIKDTVISLGMAVYPDTLTNRPEAQAFMHHHQRQEVLQT